MAIDLPEGYVLDAPDTGLPTGYTIDAEPLDFAGRESADWAARNKQLAEINIRPQAYTSTLFQRAGNLAGRAVDLAGNTIGSAAREVNDNLIPQSVDDAFSNTFSSVKSGVNDTALARNVKSGAKYIGDQYKGFAQNNPEAAGNLQAGGDIIQALPMAKPAASMIEGAGDAIGAAAKTSLPSMSSGVADIATNATKAGLPLTVDQVAPNSVVGKGLNAMKILPLSGSNAPAFQQGLNKAVMKAAGMESDVMTAPVLQARAAELGNQFKSYTENKVFPSTPIKSIIPAITKNVPKDIAAQLNEITEPLLAEAKLGPVSGSALDKARISANELMRNSDDYGTKQAAGKLHDAIVNSIVGNDPAKAAEYKKLLGDYKAYKTVEDTYAQSKAGNIDPTAFQQAVMRNYGGDKGLIETDMGKLAKAATTYGTKPGWPWKVGRGVTGMLEAGAAYHSPEIAMPVIAANRAIQYFINRNPAIVETIMSKGVK